MWRETSFHNSFYIDNFHGNTDQFVNSKQGQGHLSSHFLVRSLESGVISSVEQLGPQSSFQSTKVHWTRRWSSFMSQTERQYA